MFAHASACAFTIKNKKAAYNYDPVATLTDDSPTESIR